MPNTHDLAQHLSRFSRAGINLRQLGDRVEIHGAAPDGDAGSGQIAWISEKRLKVDPDRVRQFKGSLVVVPATVSTEGLPPTITVVEAEKPKLAFSESVYWSLPHLVGEEWPEQGNQTIHPGAIVAPSVRLAAGVVLGAGVVIDEDVEIGPNTCLAHTTVERGVVIGANCSIGLSGFGFEREEDGTLVRFPHIGRVRIMAGASVGSNTCIDRAGLGETVVGAGSKIDNLVHIAHNVEIGADSLVIANAMLGGSVQVGDRVWVAPSAAVINQVTLADDSIVGLGAVVLKSTETGQTVVGNPAKPLHKK